MARSGIGAAKLLTALGGRVTLYDSKDESHFIEELQLLKGQPVQTAFGEFSEALLQNTTLMVLSPGVSRDLWFIERATRLQIRVIGEFELAYLYCKAPLIAITGTNGKTSTTSLVGEIMKCHNPMTYVVGNIGNAFSEEVLDIEAEACVVAEVSSFQLEEVTDLKPRISAILNITEDHLNRHKTMENYIQAKLNITRLQDQNDFIVLN